MDAHRNFNYFACYNENNVPEAARMLEGGMKREGGDNSSHSEFVALIRKALAKSHRAKAALTPTLLQMALMAENSAKEP